MTSLLRLPIRQLLQFYDDPPRKNGANTTAITAVIGEELGAGLLIDYFHIQGWSAVLINKSVTQGTASGTRLDRWIKVVRGNRATYYQVEIKNWAAFAIGGRRIEVDALASQLRKHKIERWSREWDGSTFRKPKVLKVLTPMIPPEKGYKVEPLVCFWDAMHPTGADNALFSLPIKSESFARVWVFSMSAHLRNLLKSGQNIVKIDSPNIKARLDWLDKLIK